MPIAIYYLRDPFAPAPNREPICGSDVLVYAGDKILLSHKKDNFQWGIVAGGMKDNETFKACAIRVLIEQTGIHVKSDSLQDIGIFDEPSRIVSFLEGEIARLITLAFAVEVEENTPSTAGDESLELRWVRIEDLANYRLTVTDEEIIKRWLDGREAE